MTISANLRVRLYNLKVKLKGAFARVLCNKPF